MFFNLTYLIVLFCAQADALGFSKPNIARREIHTGENMLTLKSWGPYGRQTTGLAEKSVYQNFFDQGFNLQSITCYWTAEAMMRLHVVHFEQPLFAERIPKIVDYGRKIGGIKVFHHEVSKIEQYPILGVEVEFCPSDKDGKRTHFTGSVCAIKFQRGIYDVRRKQWYTAPELDICGVPNKNNKRISWSMFPDNFPLKETNSKVWYVNGAGYDHLMEFGIWYV